MASYPASRHHRPAPVKSQSAVIASVIAVLLGLLVAVLGFFALLMWMDAREARDDAAQPAAALRDRFRGCRGHDHATDHNVALPLNSFAGRRAGERGRAGRGATSPTTRRSRLSRPATLVKVQMTLKDMTVEIAPGVEYNTWAFDGHGAPGPVVHVREGQTVEMTLTNGGAIPHSIDFHAARIAPNVAFKDVAPGDSITFRFTASDPGVYMYHCGTKPVLAHIANGMYGAIVVQPRQALPAVDNEYVLVGSEWYLNGDGIDEAGLARHGEGPRDDARLGHLQRLREPVRHASADRGAGRDDPLLGRRRRPDEQRQLPRRRRDARPRLGRTAT